MCLNRRSFRHRSSGQGARCSSVLLHVRFSQRQGARFRRVSPGVSLSARVGGYSGMLWTRTGCVGDSGSSSMFSVSCLGSPLPAAAESLFLFAFFFFLLFFFLDDPAHAYNHQDTFSAANCSERGVYAPEFDAWIGSAAAVEDIVRERSARRQHQRPQRFRIRALRCARRR